MSKKIKKIFLKKQPLLRNPFAMKAKLRKAGRHKDRRKEAACKACRHGDWNE